MQRDKWRKRDLIYHGLWDAGTGTLAIYERRAFMLE